MLDFGGKYQINMMSNAPQTIQSKKRFRNLAIVVLSSRHLGHIIDYNIILNGIYIFYYLFFFYYLSNK